MEATLADYRRLMKVIETLDVVTNQVLIDATIAEITLNDDLKFGVRWSLQGKLANYSFTDDAAGAVSSVFPGFSYAVKAANIAGSLNALNNITNVNVISSPSLTVAANKTAMLQVGDQVPITTQSAVSVLTTGAPLVNSVSYATPVSFYRSRPASINPAGCCSTLHRRCRASCRRHLRVSTRRPSASAACRLR
jgi:general secretion pathway protein D